MRMLRVALVLFVLASFIVATAAVSMAATVTPTVKPTAKPTAKATMKPTGTMKPIKTTGKMIDLQQMKSNIGGIYNKLKVNTKMPAKSGMPKNNTTAMGGVKKTASGMNQPMSKDKYSPSMELSTPSMRSIQTPAIMNQLGSMPKLAV